MKATTTTISKTPRTPTSEAPGANLEKEKEIAQLKQSVNNISNKELVIINPDAQGAGDDTLGAAIADLAQKEGGRVSIVKIDATDKKNTTKIMSFNTEKAPLESLNNPSFIVAPVGALATGNLKNNITSLCNKYNFQKESIFLIEEMDLLKKPEYSLELREKILEKTGFKKIESHRLGFHKESLGYIPLPSETISQIKERAATELSEFMAKIGQKTNKNDQVYVGYLGGGDASSSGLKTFISNTLHETEDGDYQAHYFIIPGDGTAEILMDFFMTLMLGEPGTNNNNLFRRADVSFISPEGELKQKGNFPLCGSGKRKINLFFSSRLPRNLFLDLIHLSKSGIMTGDQSLGEYISIKEEMPYYHQPDWKIPLSNGLRSMTKSRSVLDELDHRIIGRKSLEDPKPSYKLRKDGYSPSTQTLEQKEEWAKFNSDLTARKADDAIRKIVHQGWQNR